MRPVYFSSRIHLVSFDQFYQLPVVGSDKPERAIIDEYNLETRVVNEPEAYTTQAYMCNAGGFHNREKVSMFHLFPRDTLKKPDEIEDAFAEDTWVLQYAAGKNQKKALRGLLTGGKWKHRTSHTLFRKLQKLFRQYDIPVSVLWGQDPNCATNLAYSGKTDTWSLSTRRFYGDCKGVQTLSDLRDYFRIISVAKGDTLILGDHEFAGPVQMGSR